MNDDIEQALTKVRKLAHAEDYDTALRMVDELAKHHPEDAKVWVERGHVNAMRGTYEVAITDMSEAIALRPTEPDYFFTRGRFHFSTRKFAEAIGDFTRTLELCDSCGADYYRTAAYLIRADAYLRLGQYDNARTDCEHVPDNIPMWTDKVRCKADILAECP